MARASRLASHLYGIRSHGRDARAIDVRQQFADAVDNALAGQGAILRYSQRLALLRLAATLQIPRFEANLIIATVQYRRSTRGTALQAMQHRPENPNILNCEIDTHGLKARATGRPTPLRTLFFHAAVFAAVQAIITLAALRLVGM